MKDNLPDIENIKCPNCDETKLADIEGLFKQCGLVIKQKISKDLICLECQSMYTFDDIRVSIEERKVGI